MPGTIYEIVKKYDDRALFTATQYKSKIYQPETLNNKMTLMVVPIEKAPAIAEEYGIALDLDQEALRTSQACFAIKCHSQFWLDHVDDIFWDSVDELPIGATLSDLKKKYKAKLNDYTKQKMHDWGKENAEREKEYKQQQANAKKKEYEEKKEKNRAYDIFRAFIVKPVCRKSSDTPKGIYDFFEVEVSLSMLVDEEDVHPLIEKYKDKIAKDVIDKVAESPQFMKMDISPNLLQIDKILYRKETRTLHYLLSLKI